MLNRFKNWLSRRRQPTLFLVLAGLLGANVLIPDPIPFVDEIILLIATTLVGRWRRGGESAKVEESKRAP